MVKKKRFCSQLTKSGERCRAWAVRESEPPRCSAHGGYSVGAGAPAGNQNALKHGFYARGLRPEEIGQLERLKERSLMGELVLARVMVMRLVDFVKGEGCTAEETTAVMKYVFSGLRTIAYLERRIEGWDEGIWEEVLREMKSER